MTDDTWFHELLKQREDAPDYLAEGVLLDITEQIAVRLRDLQMSAADLAKRLGVSRAYISQIMNGKPNMTVRTVVGIAHALDRQVSVKLEVRKSARFELHAFKQTVRVLTPERDHVHTIDPRDSAAAA